MDDKNKDDAPLSKVLGMFESLSNDLHNNSDRLLIIERKIDNILDAFPPVIGGNSFFDHRAFHVKKTEECKESRETRAMLKRNVMLYGTLAFLGVCGLGVWLVFLSKLPHS